MSDATKQYTQEELETGYTYIGRKRYKLKLNKKTGRVTEVYEPEKIKIYNRLLYYLSDEEVKKLKDTALTYQNKSNIYYAMICLMVDCGLRRDNVVNLRVEQLDFKEGIINIKKEDIKSRKPVVIPLTEELERILRIFVGDRKEGYVFLHTNIYRKTKPLVSYRVEEINNIVAKIGKKAGILPKQNFKNLNPHILRRTWGLRCMENGIDSRVVAVMGMSEKMQKEVYSVPSLETIKKQAKLLKVET